ncbi:MAG: hypothetical protein AAF745_17260, partial [Planctomycetota bacterium]
MIFHRASGDVGTRGILHISPAVRDTMGVVRSSRRRPDGPAFAQHAMAAMSDELEPTIDLSLKGAINKERFPVVDSKRAAQLDVRTGSNSVDLSRRFDDATRRLLRERLMIASVTLIGLILVVFVLTSIFESPSIREYTLRALSLTAAIFVYVCLRRRPDASLRMLRVLEAGLFAVPLLEACTSQVFETQRLWNNDMANEIPIVHALIQTAVAVFIAIYGMFIPARWYRTAVVTGIAALVPTVTAKIQTILSPELATLGIPNLGMTALLVMMAAVATLGARLVHVTRKAIESARRFGQYELTQEIGRGGMGVVYRAEHRMLKRPAAIKLIRAESALDDRAVARFESEVQLSATLSHWNTVQIFDYGRTMAGDFYYVMEYLEGQSL